MNLRFRRGTLRAGAVLAAVALFAAACGDDDDPAAPGPGDETTTTEPGDAPPPDDGCTVERRGGSLTMATFSTPDGLDPAVGSGSGLSSGRVGGAEGILVYDVLLTHDEQTGEFTPRLAESVTPNEDNSEWTLRLRPGIEFDNGDPLDAEAVVTSIARHTAEGSVSTVRRGLALVEEMEVVDDLTVVFHLTQPWGFFPMTLASTAGMITNQAVVDERGEDFNVNPAGAGVGPYRIERFTPAEELVLRAKDIDEYWGDPVCIEELRFVFVGASPVAFENLRANQVDLAFLQEAETIAQAREQGFAGLEWVLQAGDLVLINNGLEGTDPPTADVRVRQAVGHALDTEFIDQRQFNSTGLPTSSLIHPDSPLFPGIGGPEFNRERAEELVQEVKDETGWDGSIRLLCNDAPARQAAALAIQTLLNAVGMDVRTELVTVSRLISQVISDRDYDLACWGVNFTTSDIWFSISTFASDSLSNFTGIADDQMDEALDQLRAAGTSEELSAAMGAMQQRWNEIVPSAVFGALQTFVAYDADRVRGLDQTLREKALFFDAYIAD